METLTRLAALERFAQLIEKQTIDRLKSEGMPTAIFTNHYEVKVKPGNKYTKIDRGSSGYLMIDADGNIFGIKAYGVIHKGHYYETLDTVNDYNWGDYTPRKVV